MRRLRAVPAVMALVAVLLMVGGSVAAAGPVENRTTVPGPAPDPDPTQPATAGGGPTRLGSVSDVAEALAEERSAVAIARSTNVGRYASPAAKSAAIWNARGRPERLIVIRRGGIDSVANGRLLRHVVRPVSSISLTTLAYSVPSTWLSIDGSTARLSASVVLTTDVTLVVGDPVSRLLLTGGAAAPSSASVFVGGGALTIHGTTVTSADPVTGEPMPDRPGRPYLTVAARGRLDIIDSAVNGLGSTVGRTTRAGVTFGAGSHGSVVRTALTRNTVGLTLQESSGVRLEGVTASQSATEGIVLSGDTDTSLLDVVAEDNGANGVVVTGRSSPRVITGITTHANHNFGLVVVGQDGPRISRIATRDDGAGGVEINHSTDVSLSTLTTAAEPIGLYIHVSSAHLTLDHVSVTGGRRGVVIEKTTADLTLAASELADAQLGISLGGHQMRLNDVSLVNTETAAVIERGAASVMLDGLRIDGGDFGVIANPGTSGVIVRNLAADGVATTAVRALSPGGQILGGRIDGSVTGIDVQAPTTLSGVTIVGSGTGVRARTPMSVHAEQVDVTAIDVGINVADGTPFVLADSRVHALESIRGTTTQSGVNDLSLPTLSVLGAIGVPLILLAVLLECFAALWQRRPARRPDRSVGFEDLVAPPVRTDLVGAGAGTSTGREQG